MKARNKKNKRSSSFSITTLEFSFFLFFCCFFLIIGYVMLRKYEVSRKHTFGFVDDPRPTYFNQRHPNAVIFFMYISILIGIWFIFYSIYQCSYMRNQKEWYGCHIHPMIKLSPLISVMAVVVLYKTKFKKRTLTNTEFWFMYFLLTPFLIFITVCIFFLTKLGVFIH